MNFVVWKELHPYEIEHIWAMHYSRYKNQFSHQKEFEEYRNYLGGLLLLPKKINASLNDSTYKHKLKHYLKENMLARSLHDKCYENNPGFLKMVKLSGLSFKPYDDFNTEEFDERQGLYSAMAEKIWSIKRLDEAVD